MVGGCLRSASLTATLVCAAQLSASEEVVIRGEAVCLGADGSVSGARASCPDEPDGGWAIRSGDGELHVLPAGDPRIAMLNDVRVRSKDLQLTAWRDESGELAAVHLRTVIDGVLHDPHYYCDVCSVRSHERGPCWCCQAPFEFREPPLEDQPEG